MVTIMSQCFSALSLWAMMNVVRPRTSRSIVSNRAASVFASIELVGSSRTRIGASFKTARASAGRHDDADALAWPDLERDLLQDRLSLVFVAERNLAERHAAVRAC